ncbi:hypothetical protein CesoFtcFv8_022783 [Champsocephalus esox]|uniref:Uncharacterized protein n=1 Tax=Champsocephalus esox TaxID=159716 RepID=A0AAN8B6W9_9TELE|nr:hypothetical protein CesoFtcFv8_022783 [Champsocephalus esox]
MEYGVVDCHCHSSAREFEKDLEDAIQRTEEVVPVVGEFDRVLPLQGRYPDLVAPCFGLHPLQEGGQRSVDPRIGLHFTPWCAPSHRDREDQLSVFITQLGVATELQLPVNVHSRSAARVAMETMREQGVGRALLRNFAGKPSVALEGVKAGLLFSFPPPQSAGTTRETTWSSRSLWSTSVWKRTLLLSGSTSMRGTSPVTSLCAADTSLTSKVCRHKLFRSSARKTHSGLSQRLKLTRGI